MQSTQKGEDASMEDILASIRKIIADDPSRIPAVVASPPPPAPSTRPPTAPIAEVATPGAAKPSALDRDLADLLRDPVELPAPPALLPPPTATPAVTAAAPPASLATPVSAPANREPAALSGGLSGWLRSRSGNGAALQASPTPPKPAEPSLSTTVAALPATSQVDGTANASAAAAAQPASSVNGMESILQRLSGPAAQVTAPVAAPVAVAADPEIAPLTATAPLRQADVAPANRIAAAPEPPPPAQQPFIPVEVAAPAAAAPVVAQTVALEIVPGKVAHHPAALPIEDTAPAGPPAAPVAAAPADIGSPPLSDVEPAAAKDAEKATLEGTLAQLLRPMVRQWLDQNMTRALETAVRIELADGLKNGSAGQKPGDKG